MRQTEVMQAFRLRLLSSSVAAWRHERRSGVWEGGGGESETYDSEDWSTATRGHGYAETASDGRRW